MKAFNLGFEVNEDEPKTIRHSAFEYATKLLLPALSIIALTVVALVGKQTRLLWGLLVLAFLSLGVGFYPSLRARVRRRSDRAKDDRAAKQAFPKLRRFVHQFGNFVDTRTNDTLHAVLMNDVCRNNTTDYAKLHIPEIGLWHGFWYHFMLRIDRQRPSPSELQYGLMEFHSLVGLYNNSCVLPVFERFPQEFQAALTPQAKSSLNLFQQRFVRFLANYEEFAKELCESRPAFERLPYSFSHPKPL